MKKAIIITIEILAAILFCLELNRVMMPKYVKENKDGRITQEYYDAAKYSDVIFVGSSTVFSGVSPKVIWEEEGISSFNRANASQAMWISYYMIEEAIKLHKPELVCLDMTFIKHADDFVEEPSTRKSLDGMKWSSSKIDCIRASMGEDEKMLDYVIPFFRFHSRWKELSWDDVAYAWYNKPVTLNGYIGETKVDAADPSAMEYSGDFENISPKNMDYLERTINLCRDNGVNLLLFKTPAFSSNWSDSLDEKITEVAQNHGISYFNFDRYYEDIGLDPLTDTSDKGAHLNLDGAAKFSEYFAGLIRSEYDVSDRSDDEAYKAYWNGVINRSSDI